MKIALAQMRMDRDPNVNLEKTVASIHRASLSGADLILFPELQLTPFFPNQRAADVQSYLMDVDGREVRTIVQACLENRIAACPNLYLRENGKAYDASLFIDKTGNIQGISKMVHIASFPNFYEAEYYTPSDNGFLVYDFLCDGRICKVGVVICFDRHFPESIRSCALMGAEVILIPTANLMDEPREMFLWELRVQAMQNSVYIAMCNRTGTENGVEFCGESVVIDYCGNVVTIVGQSQQLLTAEVKPESAMQKRRELPYFAVRRPECYVLK